MCAQHSAPASAELAMNPELSSNRIVLYKTDFDPDFVEREEDEQEPHCR
jgi:hypothetical protein